MKDKDLLTATEVANQINCSTSSIYKAVQNNDIPHFRFGRNIRIVKRHVRDYMGDRFNGCGKVTFPDGSDPSPDISDDGFTFGPPMDPWEMQ